MKVVAVLYPGADAAHNPEVLACAENALGLRGFLEDGGHELVSTTKREGEELMGHLREADVLVTTPFWPVYVTKEMLGEAENLKLILTAGVGSDHVDLGEAAERNITVAEITGSNTVSVAEHAVMQVLALVRNFVPRPMITASCRLADRTRAAPQGLRRSAPRTPRRKIVGGGSPPQVGLCAARRRRLPRSAQPRPQERRPHERRPHERPHPCARAPLAPRARRHRAHRRERRRMGAPAGTLRPGGGTVIGAAAYLSGLVTSTQETAA